MFSNCLAQWHDTVDANTSPSTSLKLHVSDNSTTNNNNNNNNNVDNVTSPTASVVNAELATSENNFGWRVVKGKHTKPIDTKSVSFF